MKPRFRFIALAAALALGVGISGPASADRGGGGRGYYGHGNNGHGYYGHGYYGRGYYGRRGYYPSFGFYFGSPYPYYPYPYWGPSYPYYPPAVVAVPSSPPVYIERGDGSNAAPVQNDTQAFWYYCAGSNAYYPYVKQCPGGWERQVPMPPPDAR